MAGSGRDLFQLGRVRASRSATGIESRYCVRGDEASSGDRLMIASVRLWRKGAIMAYQLREASV